MKASFNLKRTLRARTRPVVVVDKTYAGGVAEDTDVDIQPITRADFVPAKVSRSRSMNTRAAGATRRMSFLGLTH